MINRIIQFKARVESLFCNAEASLLRRRKERMDEAGIRRHSQLRALTDSCLSWTFGVVKHVILNLNSCFRAALLRRV